MKIPEQTEAKYKENIPEPVIFEYIYRLPLPLRFVAILLLAVMIIGPIVIFIFSEELRRHLPDNFFFIFIFIPALFNLVFYKKRYLFTNKGIYVVDKEKGKSSSNSMPRLLMEWGDYDRFKRTLLGFKIYSHAPVEEYAHMESEQGLPPDAGKIVLGGGSVRLLCNSEDASQVEYFLISRNIHPSEIG